MNSMEIITCNVCLFASTNPMRASCGHVFCWPCLYRMLDSPPSIPGHAKPCPACPTTTTTTTTTTPEDDEVTGGVSVVPGAQTRDLAEEDEEDGITDTTRTARPRSLELPPSHDAHGIVENGVDRTSKDEATNSVDKQLQGVEIRSGVISRACNFLSTRYGNAIEEYIAIHRELVDAWVGGEVAPSGINTAS